MVDIILRLMRRVELLLKLSLFFPQKIFFFNHIIILWLTKKWYRKRFILNYSKLEKIKIITNFTNLNIFLQFQGKLAQRVFPQKLSWFTSISIKRNKKRFEHTCVSYELRQLFPPYGSMMRVTQWSAMYTVQIGNVKVMKVSACYVNMSHNNLWYLSSCPPFRTPTSGDAIRAVHSCLLKLTPSPIPSNELLHIDSCIVYLYEWSE